MVVRSGLGRQPKREWLEGATARVYWVGEGKKTKVKNKIGAFNGDTVV